MTESLPISRQRGIAIFECIADLVGTFAQFGAGSTALTLDDLNEMLRQGTALRMTTSVGHFGPLGVLIQSVSSDGSVFDIVNIEAPLADKPFRFR